MPIDYKNIKACMSAQHMIDKFPDEEQRFAVCKSVGLTQLEIPVPTDKDQEILAFPRGRFYIEKLGDWLEFDDAFFESVITNFQDSILPKPFIDKNHEYKESYGDILEFFIVEEGLKAKIKLNSKGIEVIKGREYTSISPSFGDIVDTSGNERKNILLAITLTNVPALMGNYPELQEQIRLERGARQTMKFTELCRKLNLSMEASEDAITSAVQGLLDMIAAQGMSIDDLKKKLDEMAKMKDEAMKASEDMSRELQDIKSKEVAKEAEAVILEAIAKGKIHPALKQLKIDAYKKDKASIVKELELLPVTINTQLTRNNFENGTGIDEEMKKIALERGLDLNNPKHMEILRKAVS